MGTTSKPALSEVEGCRTALLRIRASAPCTFLFAIPVRATYRQFSIIIRLLDCSSSCGKNSHLPSLETGIAPI